MTLLQLAVVNMALGTHDLSGVFTLAQEIREHLDHAIWVDQHVSVFCRRFRFNLRTLDCRSRHVGGLHDQRRRIALIGQRFNSARRREFEIHDAADKANQSTYASYLAAARACG